MPRVNVRVPRKGIVGAVQADRLKSMVEMMEAAVWEATGLVAVRGMPRPAPMADEVLIRPVRVGICGSDIAIIKGVHARAKPGIVLGHEIVGVLCDDLEGTAGAGGLVAIRPLLACAESGASRCEACQDGNEHVCAHLKLYGVDVPGGMADLLAVKKSSVVPFQSEISPEVAVLAEPLAVAVHGLHRADPEDNDAMVVFGGGPIGLLTALLAQHHNHRVIIVDRTEPRLSVARSLGLTAVSVEASNQELFDELGDQRPQIVFDASGRSTVASRVTEVTRIRGKIVILGVHDQPPVVDLRTVNFAEHTIIGSRVYRREDFETAVRLIDSSVLPLDRIPTQNFPRGRAQEGFDRSMAGGSVIKVTIG